MRFLIIAGFSDSLVGFRKPLIQALIDNGLSVYAAAPNLIENTRVNKELLAMGVKTYSISLQRTGLNPLSDFKSLISLYRLTRIIRPSYMLAYTIKPVIYGTIAAWIARIPNRFALITGLAYAFQGESGNVKRNLIKKVAINLYRLALQRSQLVFFQNPDDEAMFKKIGILSDKSKTCIVNGSGVELEHYQFQEKYPVINEAPVFLLIARLLGDKGIREYALAAAEIKNKYPEAIFNLAGWIDDTPDAIKQDDLDKWINSGAINYLGRLKDVRSAINNCSVYVLPSYGEGTPRSVLEAMSMGRAVITTDVPGCRETVVNGVNGFLVSAKNHMELSNAMLKFIEQPELISSMGIESRKIAVNKYDVNKVNSAMLTAMGIVQL